MAPKTKKTQSSKLVEDVAYSGKDIKELPFPLAVQKRTSMYLGTADERAMNHGVQEIVNNCVDEFLAGFCTHIVVKRLGLLGFSIKDNGRGVPFDTQPDGTPTLKKIFGSLHAGRNFKENDEKTDYSTGLNGVGASAVNALSASFEVISRRGKTQGSILFENGYVKEVDHAKLYKQKDPFLKSSTEVRFTYNPEFFEEGSVPVEESIIKLIRETAYLNTGLHITYIDIDGKVNVYQYDDGIKQLLAEKINEADGDANTTDEKTLFDPIYFPSEVVNKTKIEIAFTYRNTFKGENITSFCNTINTALGGTAVTGFKRALSMRLTAYIRDRGLVKEKFSNEDIFVGLEAIVSVFVFHPKFSDQLKQKLDNKEVNGHVYSYALQHLEWWLSTDPKEMKILASKIQLSAKARIAQKRALENVKKDTSSSLMQSMNNPDKFIDCVDKTNNGTELFIVEGDSASGTISVARDKNYQAIYKLKGKILNSFGMDVSSIRANNEIDDIIVISKCGAGRACDPDKSRFEKFIFLCDADADGKHIEMLLSTLFSMHMRPLVEAGKVYIAISPLYRVIRNNAAPVYLQDENALNDYIVKELEEHYWFCNEKGKRIQTAKQNEYVRLSRFYINKLKEIADKYNTEPYKFETVILGNPDLEFPESIQVDFNEETLRVDIKGFYSTEHEDLFIYMNANIEELEEDLESLLEIYAKLETYSNITDTKGNSVFESHSLFTKLSKLFESIRKSMTITRFKGLGECEPDELWDSSINPETRKLVRISIPEEYDEDELHQVIASYMSKHNKCVQFRKQLILDGFDKRLKKQLEGAF